jgi:epoxyqueuosine reductase QueG
MTTEIITTLDKEIETFLKERGAIRVGFATLETLFGGPPSADLTYILPEARSAISFALPLDRDMIRRFLAKETHKEAQDDDFAVNLKSSKLARELAEWLESKGFNAVGVECNNVYRKEVKDWKKDMPPDLSHRYIAARSGVGSFGWSGNIGIKDYGTAIILGTVVTDAELEPTDPIPSEDSFCTGCKLCTKVCSANFFDAKEKIEVIIGGVAFNYSVRHSKYRCQLICGGFSGLHPSGKWSTWSPGRFTLPEGDDENRLAGALVNSVTKYLKWPERRVNGEPEGGGYFNMILKEKKILITCGMCQKICFGNKEETRKNYEMLTKSGCVLQEPDGNIIVLPPEEAETAFNEFPPKHRKLYC